MTTKNARKSLARRLQAAGFGTYQQSLHHLDDLAANETGAGLAAEVQAHELAAVLAEAGYPATWGIPELGTGPGVEIATGGRTLYVFVFDGVWGWTLHTADGEVHANPSGLVQLNDGQQVTCPLVERNEEARDALHRGALDLAGRFVPSGRATTPLETVDVQGFEIAAQLQVATNLLVEYVPAGLTDPYVSVSIPGRDDVALHISCLDGEWGYGWLAGEQLLAQGALLSPDGQPATVELAHDEFGDTAPWLSTARPRSRQRSRTPPNGSPTGTRCRRRSDRTSKLASDATGTRPV